MADKLLPGLYLNADSLLHRLDPRTKLLSVILFTLCCLVVPTLGGYLAATVLTVGQLLLSHVAIRRFLASLKPVLLILSFTFIYHLSQEGWASGVFIVWRILLLLCFASVLTWTTKPLDLAKGLEQLLKPLSRLGVPTEAFALMVVIAIRFIPTISMELDRIMLAQKARGFEINAVKGPKRAKAYLQLIIPLLITTIQRAEQLAMTIDARAYGNGRSRTSYRVLTFSRLDYAAGGLMLVFAMLILYLSLGQEWR